MSEDPVPLRRFFSSLEAVGTGSISESQVVAPPNFREDIELSTLSWRIVSVQGATTNIEGIWEPADPGLQSRLRITNGTASINAKGDLVIDPNSGFQFEFDYGAGLQTSSQNSMTGGRNTVIYNEVQIRNTQTGQENAFRGSFPFSLTLSDPLPAGSDPIHLEHGYPYLGHDDFNFQRLTFNEDTKESFISGFRGFRGSDKGIRFHGGYRQDPTTRILRNQEIEPFVIGDVPLISRVAFSADENFKQFLFRADRFLATAAGDGGDGGGSGDGGGDPAPSPEGSWSLHNALGWVFDTRTGWQFSQSRQQWFWIDGSWGWTEGDGWYWLGTPGWIWRESDALWIQVL